MTENSPTGGDDEGAAAPASPSPEKPPSTDPRAEMVGIGANVGVAVVVFVLGVIVGFPLATFGIDFLTENAGEVFGVMFGILMVALLVAGVILVFRKPIWDALFHRGQIEMERFARPMAEVAKFAAQAQVEKATDAARDLAEMVLARYAWVSTRRWMMATITAFIAAIAALAGSALLFQQNQLLRNQIGLMEVQNERVAEQTGLIRNQTELMSAQTDLMSVQNDRVAEQNRFIETQIELGEAQRSTAIVPEILDLGGLVGEEAKALLAAQPAGGMLSSAQLSVGLRSRLIAATNAARPYRYLRSPLFGAADTTMNAAALSRRTDLPRLKEVVDAQLAAANEGIDSDRLTDRPVSPERGQLISMLFSAAVYDLEELSFLGADFSFAEVRLPTLALMNFRHGLMRFADFSGVQMRALQFGGAFAENIRMRRAVIGESDFSGLSAADETGPYTRREGDGVWRTALAGADFYGSFLRSTHFRSVNGLAMNFDGALLDDVDFTSSDISASTFRGAIIGDVDFSGAEIRSVDFDGAFVLDPNFLDAIAAAVVPETFNRARFEIAEATADDLSTHPQWAQLDIFPGLWNGSQVPYRITRVLPFE